jgi:hypothetical protein
MSRAMRSSARKPTKATATTIVKSEIGRRNANDTRFIVAAQPVVAHGRPNPLGRRPTKLERRLGRMRLGFFSICSIPEIARSPAVRRAWRANRLGWPEVCRSGQQRTQTHPRSLGVERSKRRVMYASNWESFYLDCSNCPSLAMIRLKVAAFQRGITSRRNGCCFPACSNA